MAAHPYDPEYTGCLRRRPRVQQSGLGSLWSARARCGESRTPGSLRKYYVLKCFSSFALLLLVTGCFGPPPGPRLPYVVLATESARLEALDQCSRYTPLAEDTFVPNDSEVQQLEADLHKLRRMKAHHCCMLKMRLLDPGSYYRQYIGIKSSGRRLIYINAFPDDPPPDDWRERGVGFCDGGPTLWGVVYDPETREFRELAFNGLA